MAQVEKKKSFHEKTADEVKKPDLNAVQEHVVAWLYSTHGANNDELIKSLEAKTSLKREHLVAIASVLTAGYLIFGNLAQTVCNLIGFLYPSYESVKAIRTVEKDDDTKWLIYWTVFGFFSVIDSFAEGIMSVFPIYFLAKAAFLIFLYLPQTNGAEYFYKCWVDPMVTLFDNWRAGAKEEEKTKKQ